MPELPEVETVMRDLLVEVSGRTIVDVEVGVPGVLRHPDRVAFLALLPGARIVDVARRGKYIHCPLVRRGDPDGELIFHLGMTGHIVVCDAASAPVRHTHMRARLDDGRELRFDDARRFGRILLGDRAELVQARLIPRLGMEPLSSDFTATRFDAALRSTARTVKAALLDQTVIAGLGNIYVDEACHLAGVRPARRARTLTRSQRAALFAAIPAVLEKAIRNRGTSFDDYRDIWNARGGNGESLQVYGRGGAPCIACGEALRRTTVAARTTVHCPRCQR